MKDCERLKQFSYMVTNEMTPVVYVTLQGFWLPGYRRYVVEQTIHRFKFAVLHKPASEQKSEIVVDTEADILDSGHGSQHSRSEQ